jgi:hypothetical protein
MNTPEANEVIKMGDEVYKLCDGKRCINLECSLLESAESGSVLILYRAIRELPSSFM